MRDFRNLESSSLAVFALVGVNLIPLAGVVLWDWTVGEVVLLYWLENGIIGFYAILRIIFSGFEEEDDSPGDSKGAKSGSKLGDVVARQNSSIDYNMVNLLSVIFLVIFFCFHYGIFWIVHGVFVIALLVVPYVESADFDIVFRIGIGVAGLFVSHGISFWRNYLSEREFVDTNPKKEMGRPYSRVVVLHIVIIIGAFLVAAFGSPLPALILLIVLKTGVDLGIHYRDHRKGGQKG